MEECKTILDAGKMDMVLDSLAAEFFDRRGEEERMVIVGIQRRGVDLAVRLKARLEKLCGKDVPMGMLDINFYRDDWSSVSVQPMINKTEIPVDIEGASLLLVDDVLFSGRTVRAALEAIMDYGRPHRVELMVLIDRGHRELPIQPDYVGEVVETASNEHVNVLVSELDDEDKVCLVR